MKMYYSRWYWRDGKIEKGSGWSTFQAYAESFLNHWSEFIGDYPNLIKVELVDENDVVWFTLRYSDYNDPFQKETT
jgi:hypothetical protein